MTDNEAEVAWIVEVEGPNKETLDLMLSNLTQELRANLPDATVARRAAEHPPEAVRSGSAVEIGDLIIALTPFLAQQLVDLVRFWAQRQSKSKKVQEETQVTESLEVIEFKSSDIQVRLQRKSERK